MDQPIAVPPSVSRGRKLFLCLLMVILGVLCFLDFSRSKRTSDPPLVATLAQGELLRGRDLSKTYCQSCHLYPEPAIYDRFTWTFEILPVMARTMGLHQVDYDHMPGGNRVREAGVIPSTPLMNYQDWRAICQYYMASAPAHLSGQSNAPAPAEGLPGFVVKPMPYNRPPAISMVRIDPGEHSIYMGNLADHTLDRIHAERGLLDTVKIPGAIVSLHLDKSLLYLTDIGYFMPSDEPAGKVINVSRRGEIGSNPAHEIFNNLQRPLQTLFVDLNHDGLEDIVIPEFGDRLGQLVWEENLGHGR